jgi:hypothetical protein
MQEQNTLRTPPTLFLGAKIGPSLKLIPEPTEIPRDASPTWLAIALFGLIGLAALTFLIPLSQGRFQSPWSEELRLGIHGLWDSNDGPEDRDTSEIQQAAASTQEITDSDVSALMEKLKGKYCFNYMPAGDDPAARAAFLKIYWSKLNVELTQLTEARLDVCSPFAYRTPDVMVGGGCQKSNCGTNDVGFYINRQGKIAMDYRIEGECRYANEDGFTQISLLCSD